MADNNVGNEYLNSELDTNLNIIDADNNESSISNIINTYSPSGYKNNPIIPPKDPQPEDDIRNIMYRQEDINLDTPEPINYGRDITNQDYLDYGHNYLSDWDENELRAYRQSGLSQLANGVGRAVTTFGAEVAKMPGILGGLGFGAVNKIASRGESDFIEDAFNNFWVKGIANWQEDFDDDYLPVYAKQSVEEGSLWRNITSTSFWATEFSAMVGYLGAMMVPGAGLGALSMGGRASRLLTGAFPKAFKPGSWSTRALSTLNSDTAKHLMHGIANSTFDAYNEAYTGMEQFEMELEEQLQTGEITEEEFEQQLQLKGNIGKNIFGWNLPLLIAPHSMKARIFSKGVKSSNRMTRNLLSDGFKEIERYGGKEYVKEFLKGWGAGIGSQGFVEIGGQVAIREAALENEDMTWGELFTTLPEAYLDMLKTTDGKKAIFLSGILGLGHAFKGVSNKNKNIDLINQYISKFNESTPEFLKSVDTLHTYFNRGEGMTTERNEDGTINYLVDGEIAYTQDLEGNITPNADSKVAEDTFKYLSSMEVIRRGFEIAESQNNEEAMRYYRNQLFQDYLVPFINNKDLSMEVLRQGLEDSVLFNERLENEGKTKEEFISDAMEQVTKLREVADFAERNIDIFYDLGDNDKVASTIKSDLINEAINIANKRNFFNRRERELNKERAEVLKDIREANKKSIERLKNQREKVTEKLSEKNKFPEDTEAIRKIDKEIDNLENPKNDTRLNRIDDNLSKYEVLSEELSKTESRFWDASERQPEINEAIRRHTELLETLEKGIEENLSNYIGKLDNAETVEEVKSIQEEYNDSDLTTDKSKKTFDDLVKKKQKEVEKRIVKAEKEAKESEIEESKEKRESSNTEAVEDLEITKDLINAEKGDSIFVPGRFLNYLDKVDRDKLPENYRESKEVFLEILNETDYVYEVNVHIEDTIIEKAFLSKETLKPISDHINKGSSDNGRVEGNTLKDGSEDATIKDSDYNKVDTTKEGKDRDDPTITSKGDAKVNLKFKDKDGKVVTNKYPSEEATKKASKYLNNPINKEGAKLKIDFDPQETYSAENTKNIEKGVIDKAINGYELPYDNFRVASHVMRLVLNGELTLSKEQVPKVKTYLAKFLPLNILFPEGGRGQLETAIENPKSDNQHLHNTVFMQRSYKLRENIINALIDDNGKPIPGRSLENIEVTINDQRHGDIQLEVDPDTGLPKENSILEFQQLRESLKTEEAIKHYIKDNIRYVDSLGELVNINGESVDLLEKFLKKEGNNKGEVYLFLKSSNGKDIPVKLNIKRVHETHADLLADLYIDMLMGEKNSISRSRANLSEDIVNRIESNEELASFLKSMFNTSDLSSLTYRDVIDLFIVDGANRPSPSRIGLQDSKDGVSLLFGKDYKVTQEEYNNAPEATKQLHKENLSNWLQSSKRYGINFKHNEKRENFKSLGRNEAYFNFILGSMDGNNIHTEGILNTNAKVDGPLFEGLNNIYLKTSIDISGEAPTSSPTVQASDIGLEGLPELSESSTLLPETSGVAEQYITSLGTVTLHPDGSITNANNIEVTNNSNRAQIVEEIKSQRKGDYSSSDTRKSQKKDVSSQKETGITNKDMENLEKARNNNKDSNKRLEGVEDRFKNAVKLAKEASGTASHRLLTNSRQLIMVYRKSKNKKLKEKIHDNLDALGKELNIDC